MAQHLTLLILYSCFVYSALSAETISGPSSPSEWSSWINGITQQRTNDLKSIHYNGSIYNVTGIQWTQSSFIQPQMHGYDQYFYDGITTHSYTFDKWLNDLKDRYGGIDSYLYWVTYTNIGADDRNQFEMNYATPGGVEALKKMVDYMHSQNPPIKVLFPYNPWDQGTHYNGMADYKTMAQFLNETGADGFNGDTMGAIPENYYTYSVEEYNHPIALEPEGGGSLQSMNWDTMGWGYWPVNNFKPNVGTWKWYDGRRMTNVCDRWAQNHTNDMQNAFFNGIGFESWENVWGCWNGIVPRDGEALRRIGTILRYFGNRNNNHSAQNFTQSLDWLPFIPIIADTQYWNNLFASSFTVNKNTDQQQILFLIVNRVSNNINNAQISFDNSFTINSNNLHVYDCYFGNELKFTINNNKINVNINVEGLGYGAILATFDTRTNNKDLDTYLTTMNTMTQKPLNSFSSQWKYLLQTMTPIKKTKLYSTPPVNMSVIPMRLYYFENTGVEIEGSDSTGVDVQYYWEQHPRRDHSQTININKFYIDKYPVTCSQYKQYLDSSNYKPSDTYNYLKNWNISSAGEYIYPVGYDNKPVTYVSLNEARLYCEYNSKRLPHSYEWQYAGQGNSTDPYPWGNTQGMGTYFPNSQTGRTLPGPEDVSAFSPKGDSAFGVSDMIGNVWQYTDEFQDPHTRAVIVMGSANYRPSGSKWYFPVAYQLNQHNKYFLMDDSYERCGTIGFRCAADAVQPTTGPNNWNGQGTYCSDLSTGSGVLCGMLNAQDGNNNLTAYGTLDWIQFGSNSKDNSQYKMIRKQSSTQYIALNSSTSVLTYANNPNGFYWNDGGSDMPSLSIDNATTDGIYIETSSLKLNINNLKSGNIYRVRIYIGVYKDNGILNVALNIGSNKYTFNDNTISNNGGTTNMAYDLILNLETISNNEVIQLLIEWILGKGDGNITLQGIAVALVQQSQ